MIEIRLASSEDLPFLTDIEQAAGELFAQYEFTSDIPADLIPLEKFTEAQRNNLLWVAAPLNEKPVGFALVELVDGAAHLAEIDVHPEFGRQGIGTRLVNTIIEWVRSSGIAAVTLTTFRDIPWNAPFYQRLGFRVLESEELTPGLAEIVEDEERRRLPRKFRVVMRFDTKAD